MANVQDVLSAEAAKSAAYAAITLQLEALHDRGGFSDAEQRSTDAHTTATLVQSLAQLIVLDTPCCCHHDDSDVDG